MNWTREVADPGLDWPKGVIQATGKSPRFPISWTGFDAPEPKKLLVYGSSAHIMGRQQERTRISVRRAGVCLLWATPGSANLFSAETDQAEAEIQTPTTNFCWFTGALIGASLTWSKSSSRMMTRCAPSGHGRRRRRESEEHCAGRQTGRVGLRCNGRTASRLPGPKVQGRPGGGATVNGRREDDLSPQDEWKRRRRQCASFVMLPFR